MTETETAIKELNDYTLEFKTAGHYPTNKMRVGCASGRCQEITDGVDFEFFDDRRGRWAGVTVLAFEDLERWYKKAKKYRETHE